MKPPAAKKNRKRKKKGASASAPPQGDAAAAAAAPSAADGGESMEGKEEAAVGGGGGVGDEERVLNWLVDAFSSTSLEQVRSAYLEARGDPLRAADILGTSSEGSMTSESSSSREAPAAEKRIGGSRKQKKVVASTGLVSDVIGRGYGGSVYGEGGRRTVGAWNKGPWNERYTLEEAEEFLCSIVGGTCELDPAVVKDVFGTMKTLEFLA
ncbi:hypothetical protein Taro_005177 [Colocasia esculenta]|uniref:At5g58720/SDE5-like UBA-like domain-containing protein n=1 Tax=Colocasia esculenta TaxID=4460 RepID=A0A843TTN4_COLES|nr:hypothetical protein [Colocasia esculenta]